MEDFIKQLELCTDKIDIIIKQNKIPVFYNYTDKQQINFLGYYLDTLAIIRAVKKIYNENNNGLIKFDYKLTWKQRWHLIKRILTED